eukprot:Clim_evm22s200 gene=Clim_evmTU22s200
MLVVDNLRSIGIVDGTLAMPALRPQLSTIKNSARRAYHRNQAEMLSQLLEDTMASCDSQSMAKTEELMYGNRWRRKWVRDFVQNHKANIGVHPFLRGVIELCKLMKRAQTLPQTIVVWSINDAVLSQAGTAFLKDSVTLLCGVFGAVAEILDGGETIIDSEEDCSYQRDWYFAPQTDKTHLAEIASALPSPCRLEGLPSGDFRTESLELLDSNMQSLLTHKAQTAEIQQRMGLLSCFGALSLIHDQKPYSR